MINWTPAERVVPSTRFAPSDVSDLAGFLQATGWQVIYGINLKTNTPANAASEAQYAATALDSSLLAFEIGNEPNEYTSET
jgi:hypothetical protein